MSPPRPLFSARAARLKVGAAMRALVQAAVFLASADGHVEEPEVEALVDALRAVMARLVGDERLDDYAKVSTLLDEARGALRHLATQGETPYLEGVARALEGDLRRDALDVAQQVVFADGQASEAERAAVTRLASALGLPPPELPTRRPA
ncbi:MAG: tellurite resistance TerB family protein [Myxococcaceae bacterium]|jgi:tellurite resistance protein|nr:tellurite resistance TerB family protein [Myxococcaceae bacterium]MCA3011970.1 tellurite resistance TerB family protein [Myxococcaceae bacterium]